MTRLLTILALLLPLSAHAREFRIMPVYRPGVMPIWYGKAQLGAQSQAHAGLKSNLTQQGALKESSDNFNVRIVKCTQGLYAVQEYAPQVD